jgi:general secretion pathway protein G
MSALRSAHRICGFTLIELLVTVAIVGLLTSISFPLLELTTKRTKEHELRDALRLIRGAIDAYKQASDEGRVAKLDIKGSGYPPSLDVLVSGVPDAKNPKGDSKIYFLRALPVDPMFAQSDQQQSSKWGLRSYASSHESPEPGLDVFDVYSQSTGVGLNGVPYREW